MSVASWVESANAWLGLLAAIIAGALWVWQLPQSRALRAVVREFQPDGGSTLRDLLDNIRDELVIQREGYRFLMDTTDAMVFEADAAGAVRHVSLAFCAFAGMDRNDALNHGWLLAVHEPERSNLASRWLASVQTGVPFEVVCTMCGRETSDRWRMRLHVRAVRRPSLGTGEDKTLYHFGTFTKLDPVRE